MPASYLNNGQETRHSDDIQDIITTVPSWILRWGITLFLGLLLLGVGLSAFIRYPDIVKASLKIDSPNAPKPVVAKTSGKLIKLLVTENQSVTQGKPLAYLESTADHERILTLLTNLKVLQKDVLAGKNITRSGLIQNDNTQLGELQTAYQTFYGEYLSYLTATGNGFMLKKREFLQKDLIAIGQQQQQLEAQSVIHKRDFELAEQQYNIAKKLFQQKAETPLEFRQEESQYLARKSPILQDKNALISGEDNYTSKQKEISELDNDIQQEKYKFLQALNSIISAAEDWKSKYVLTASVSGRLSFQGIIQENEVLQIGQEVFYINPGNSQFFGDMAISQINIGKVKTGQKVLVKLKGYPYEQFGIIKGKISSIADIPYKDSVFMSRVDFKVSTTSDFKMPIHLKQGMMADAEIVTQDASILQRISWSLFKINH